MQDINTITLHGVFLNVHDTGVLVTGPSGIGKSDVALELIHRGHQLIADDAPEFFRNNSNTVLGQCPHLLRNLLEIRGLGVIDVTALYGSDSVTQRQQLGIIIALDPSTDSPRDRLPIEPEYEYVLGIPIPRVTLPVTPYRNLALLIEIIVRDRTLRTQGYNANNAFLDRQSAALMGSVCQTSATV